MEIKGYTLHGDYYLADEIIPNVNWEKARRIEKIVNLPNGETVIAQLLSKKELETIPKEERRCGKWYWTRTSYDTHYHAYNVDNDGDFFYSDIGYCGNAGGARLGFKNPF